MIKEGAIISLTASNEIKNYLIAKRVEDFSNGEGGWFGGDGAWWIILLFLFAGGWGNGGGWGGGGAGNARDAVSYGFDMNGLENGIRGLEHGLCDGFYELNTGLLTGFGNTNMAAM
jgi:hypothetical protein